MKWSVWCLCAAVALLLTACASGASYMAGDAAAGGGAGPSAMGGAAPPGAADRAQLEAEVANIERKKKEHSYLEDFGVEEGAGAAAPNAPTSCEELCQAGEGICLSSQRICEIAQSYPQEAWFAERCGWSLEQCQQAQGACQSCQGQQ